MKTTYFYKKIIGIFLAYLMLVSGIREAGQQGDSFFVFSQGKLQEREIAVVQEKIEPLHCILKQYMKFSEEIRETINQQKKSKVQHALSNEVIWQINRFYVFQKADTRLCHSQRLTDAFIIWFIHQQDGAKSATSLF